MTSRFRAGGQSICVFRRALTPKAEAHGSASLFNRQRPRRREAERQLNLSLTIRRETGGVWSNYLCDLLRGACKSSMSPARSAPPSDPERSGLNI